MRISNAYKSIFSVTINKVGHALVLHLNKFIEFRGLVMKHPAYVRRDRYNVNIIHEL